jgi:hypothetical protein
MLDDAIERSKEIYFKLGAQWQDQKKTWTFPNGARLRFRPLERTGDADKYQGQNITDACVEEAGQYPDSAPIDRLNGVLRSAKSVPAQLILTGNPGGAGQQWIKARYIDPSPQGYKVLKRALPNGKEHKYVFIPSKLENNRLLTTADPDYINRLYLVGSKKLVDAWLKGDWSAVEGSFFDEWSDLHIIKPFEMPEHWTRLISGDWGSARPFSFGWGLEDVHMRPGEGAETARNFGMGLGYIEMALISCKAKFGKIAPSLWTGRLGLSGKGKEGWYDERWKLAELFYPDFLKKLTGPRGGKRDGRLDALLIAHWMRVNSIQGKRAIVDQWGEDSDQAKVLRLGTVKAKAMKGV